MFFGTLGLVVFNQQIYKDIVVKPTVLMLLIFMLTACQNTEEQIFAALHDNDANLALSLIDEHIDVHARDPWNYTLLHRSNDLAVTQRLVELGADINAKGAGTEKDAPLPSEDNQSNHLFLKHLSQGDDFAPLHTVRNYQVLQYLIEQGADVNARSAYGDTPLHRAVWNFYQKSDEEQLNSMQAVIVLAKFGADINATNNYNETPLHKAANNSTTEPLSAFMLIKLGADLDIQNNAGQTALVDANNSSQKLVNALLGAGANAEVVDNYGNTPICYAIADGQVELVARYIFHGVDPEGSCNDTQSYQEYANSKLNPSDAEAMMAVIEHFSARAENATVQ